MALKAPRVPTGIYEPVREWSCPEHEWPQDHECDCHHCDREWDCELCAEARWETVLAPDGSPLMREVLAFDMARALCAPSFSSGFSALLSLGAGTAEVRWVEDV